MRNRRYTCITCRRYIILRKEGEHGYQTRFEVLTAMLTIVFSYGLCRLINWFRVPPFWGGGGGFSVFKLKVVCMSL
jgi:hypothetical protein